MRVRIRHSLSNDHATPTDMFAGGISSNLKALKANLFLSSAVALTGIAAPIGLSFVLLGLLPLSPVQAFAAGAALCSTSLGTTFTVLATSGLTESRLGVVLTSAAMMDDVVGLIMVQIISSLGAGSTFTEITVIRPVFVSIAFAVLIPLICLYVAKPIMLGANDHLRQPDNANYRTILCSSKASFVYQTGILLAMITGATYAGTSNLYAAYLAGASITWLDGCLANHKREQQSSTGSTTPQSAPQPSGGSSLHRPQSNTPISASEHLNTNTDATPLEHTDDCSGKGVYEKYYSPVVESILRPLFFASIGFAIPITRMFTGRVIWRGLVYTILMVFAKLICGLWLVRFASMPRAKAISKLLPSIKLTTFGFKKSSLKAIDATNDEPSRTAPAAATTNQRPRDAVPRQSDGSSHGSSAVDPGSNAPSGDASVLNSRPAANTTRKRTALPRPKSLYPAAILGSAMVARGEIGFLISSVAEANEVFGAGGNTEEFLVVTWAILLCTLIGPITVGLLVKRVKRLQQAERKKANGQEDPLGIWGVLPPSSTA
jgi:Kef-type K+ transport system membrane component KefB